MRIYAVLIPLVTVTFAGCLDAGLPEPDAGKLPDGLRQLNLADTATGAAAPLALVQALDAEGTTRWLATADLSGAANVTVGTEVAYLLAWIDGMPYEIQPDGSLAPLAGELEHPLKTTTRIAMANPIFPAQLGTTCLEKTDGDPNCGLDEPSIVVDARGWIYYTAACCFFVSSPVYVSKDGGATFENLANPWKDAYGNEGDLAIDDEGNLYYMDIDLATFGIARWNPDLSPAYGYRRPGIPLVDRPWIRAGAEGVVHAIYNTGSSTVYYRSTDHALTFSAAPVATYPMALAGAYSDVRHGIVGMLGGGKFMESRDAGATWGKLTTVPGCESAGEYDLEGAAVDESGTAWHHLGGCVVGRGPDGAWRAPVQAVPPGVDMYFAWVAAGSPGGVVISYYGQVKDPVAAESLGLKAKGWYLFVTFSTDADLPASHWTTLVVDPDPVGIGNLGRRLGDFMNVAVGPDGGIHVAYAINPEMDDSATSVYRGIRAVPGLAPSRPLVGPFRS